MRPEQGLLGLRKELGVYANLRPARSAGIDIMIVRELVGGLYFGEKGVRDDGTWFDTCEYSRPEVERIARRGFEIAANRGGRLTSVDKVNVMHTSRLWRDVVTEIGASDYPQIALDHALVDSFAMTIVQAPESIDTVVTENTFGDILSDVAAAVTGGLGLAASASLGDDGPGDLRAGARLGAADRRARDRQPGSDAPLGRAACCSTGSAVPRRRWRSRGPSTTPSPRHPRRISAAPARRARSGTPCCAPSTLPVPCDDDATSARHRFHLLARPRALRLRLYGLAGAFDPASRRLAASRRTDLQRKAHPDMASIELTVAYPGREGAHTAAACDRLFPAARLVPLPTFSDVIDAVVTGRVPFGVLPIESSLVGPVAETHDLLYESPLSIVAEAILPVNHCLVGPGRRRRSRRSGRSTHTPSPSTSAGSCSHRCPAPRGAASTTGELPVVAEARRSRPSWRSRAIALRGCTG